MDAFLVRGQQLLLILCALYLVFLSLLTIPYFQRHAIYLHALRLPLFVDFNNPVKHGLPASRSLNIQLETRDNVRLGAWLVLPPLNQKQTAFDGPPSVTEISESISTRPTILLFHGNAASRAMSFRVQHCSTYASRFGANVLAIDYRGFGDSEGTPSEDGLISDARAAWDWAVHHGATPENMLLVGLSLGTGVSAGLGAELAKEGIHPRGIILLAPFTSIKSLLYDYHLFGLIPILQPLNFYPPLQDFFAKYLITHFNSSQTLPTIKSRILLVHSKDDVEIPHSHSQSLFDGIVDQFLPILPALPESTSELQGFDWAGFEAAKKERQTSRDALVRKQEIPGFATVHRLHRPGEFGEVLFVEAEYGGHDRVGLQESLIDLISYELF
ncbi:alpha/beta-hydrolase [Fomitiporia mediterranea MF3/22]|uniref:alpha/beta-hydrolase n=1 Tax=Fomitiporia mediterranea (strain MF3/22) TaxID=694068 RepID=UPI00044095D2|nr:alpha/beta-hydrolase [Fomitiporia mediterranea MF3/22]EJC98093.1 alpha/beta-hydrolase [Fomitiporia mediterranea MF3/22]